MNDAPPADDVTFLQLVDAERSLITSGVVARRAPIMRSWIVRRSATECSGFGLCGCDWRVTARAFLYQRQVLLKYRCRPDGLTGDAVNSHRRELAHL